MYKFVKSNSKIELILSVGKFITRLNSIIQMVNIFINIVIYVTNVVNGRQSLEL